MNGLTIYDYLLFPIYLYLVFLVFKKMQAKYKDRKNLYLYFTWGFRIKIASIVIYTLLINYSLRGDSVNIYFAEGKHFTEMIKENPSQVSLLFTNGGTYIDSLADEECKGYLQYESNYLVVKFAIILCFLTFSKFLLICLILGFIAFLGSWQLFMFFYNYYPYLHKQFAIATLAIPNVIFWTSGLSKDTICMASIGFLAKALFDIFVTKKKYLANTAIAFFACFCIYTIKSYILYSFLPFYTSFLVFHSIKNASNIIHRWALMFLIPMAFLVIAYVFSDGLEEQIKEFSSEKLMESVTHTQSSFARQASTTEGSFFSIGEFDGTLSSFLSLTPKAIFATLFRPFVWESRNIIMMASAMENLALTIFIILIFVKNGGILNFFRKLLTEPLVFFCIFYTILFFAFVGVTTSNFGSLVRYKIPAIPFLICGLIIIYYKRSDSLKTDVAGAPVTPAAVPNDPGYL